MLFLVTRLRYSHCLIFLNAKLEFIFAQLNSCTPQAVEVFFSKQLEKDFVWYMTFILVSLSW